MLSVFDLKTAISMSLLTDKRADDHELPQTEVYKRGWWGDCLNPDAAPMGSKLWLLHRRPFHQETLDLAKTYTRDALAWMIQDGLTDDIDVQCELSHQKVLLIKVSLYLTRSDAPTQFWIEFPKSQVFYAL